MHLTLLLPTHNDPTVGSAVSERAGNLCKVYPCLLGRNSSCKEELPRNK